MEYPRAQAHNGKGFVRIPDIGPDFLNARGLAFIVMRNGVDNGSEIVHFTDAGRIVTSVSLGTIMNDDKLDTALERIQERPSVTEGRQFAFVF